MSICSFPFILQQHQGLFNSAVVPTAGCCCQKSPFPIHQQVREACFSFIFIWHESNTFKIHRLDQVFLKCSVVLQKPAQSPGSRAGLAEPCVSWELAAALGTGGPVLLPLPSEFIFPKLIPSPLAPCPSAWLQLLVLLLWALSSAGDSSNPAQEGHLEFLGEMAKGLLSQPWVPFTPSTFCCSLAPAAPQKGTSPSVKKSL